MPDPAESRVARRRISFRIAIGALSVFVAIVAGVVITFVVISRRFDENYRKAETYVAGAKLTLAKESRFQQVELEATTQLGGAVRVDGTVAPPSDLSLLQRSIQLSGPPVPVIYDVQVMVPTRSSTAPIIGNE